MADWNKRFDSFGNWSSKMLDSARQAGQAKWDAKKTMADNQNKTHLDAANIRADATRYGADKRFTGDIYSALSRSADTRYQSDSELKKQRLYNEGMQRGNLIQHGHEYLPNPNAAGLPPLGGGAGDSLGGLDANSSRQDFLANWINGDYNMADFEVGGRPSNFRGGGTHPDLFAAGYEFLRNQQQPQQGQLQQQPVYGRTPPQYINHNQQEQQAREQAQPAPQPQPQQQQPQQPAYAGPLSPGAGMPPQGPDGVWNNVLGALRMNRMGGAPMQPAPPAAPAPQQQSPETPQIVAQYKDYDPVTMGEMMQPIKDFGSMVSDSWKNAAIQGKGMNSDQTSTAMGNLQQTVSNRDEAIEQLLQKVVEAQSKTPPESVRKGPVSDNERRVAETNPAQSQQPVTSEVGEWLKKHLGHAASTDRSSGDLKNVGPTQIDEIFKKFGSKITDKETLRKFLDALSGKDRRNYSQADMVKSPAPWEPMSNDDREWLRKDYSK